MVLDMLSERHPGGDYLEGIRNMAWTLGGKPGLSVWMWVVVSPACMCNPAGEVTFTFINQTLRTNVEGCSPHLDMLLLG